MSELDDSVALEINSDDEFEDSYGEPASLTPEEVKDTVVYTLDWTAGTVVSQIDADPDDPESQGVLVTAPPFQRRTAWNDERQSLFIESLMLGLPIPPLVLAESILHPGQFYVLDGKQRLTALKMFLLDGTLKLKKLELLARLDGLTYKDLKNRTDLKPYVQSMLSQPIRTIVVRNWKNPALLHLIFSRLNKASVPLASHELRQALHPGKFTNYINQKSAESPAILRARRLTGPDFRLRDAETLLRYIGLKTNLSNYRGDLRDFLDRVLKGGNDNFDHVEPALSGIEDGLNLAVDTAFQIWGEAAFLRYDAGKKKYMPRFNIAVFDTITWFFADNSIASAALEKRAAVTAAFAELSSSTDTKFSAFLTSTTKTPEAVNGRIELWGKKLSECLGIKIDHAKLQLAVLPIASSRRGQR